MPNLKDIVEARQDRDLIRKLKKMFNAQEVVIREKTGEEKGKVVLRWRKHSQQY